MTWSERIATMALLGSLVGCGDPSATASTDDGIENLADTEGAIRSISTKEALADFDQISASFKGLYGAMDRKQARYKFNFSQLTSQYRSKISQAKTEAAVFGLFNQYLANFHDAHVSLSEPFVSDTTHSYSVPLLVMPIEKTYVVYALGASIATKVSKGEELLAIDGTPVATLMAKYVKYVSSPNALTNGHFASQLLTFRPSYLASGITANAPVTLSFRRADGTTHDEVLTWTQDQTFIPPAPAPVLPAAGESTQDNLVSTSPATVRAVNAEMTKFGSRVPFFMTAANRAALGITAEVQPTDAALATVGLTRDVANTVNYFAATYTFGGKKFLLVRIPSYQPANANASLSYLAALFADQQNQVDALILDETHNPGGSISFAAGVVSLLAKQTVNGYVQRMHGDRQWILSYENNANYVRQNYPGNPAADLFDARARTVDAAYSAHKSLSDPLPFFFGSTMIEADDMHWTKPVMMLADELSVSCADFVPLLFQANQMGVLFGQTTMGGGGNVEQVATLTNTRAALSISRGVGTVFDPTGAYPESRIIEDNGVTPDVLYSHTLADYRAGYVGYVQAFNNEMLKHLQ